MNLREVTYAFPQAAYLILLVLLLAWLSVLLWNYRRQQLNYFASPDLWKQLVLPRLNARFATKVFLLCVAWILAAIALMQPMSYGDYPSQGKEQLIPQRSPHQIMLFLDASASMAVPDGAGGKTRLTQSKEIADSLISLLQGQWLSIQAFTSEVNLLVPPTTDYLFARDRLRQIQINEGGSAGTSFEQLLATLRDQLQVMPPDLIKSVIILSDGGDTRLESLAPEARAEALEKMVAPWKSLMQENHLQIYTIGIGSEKGGTVPEIAGIPVIYEGKPVVSVLDSAILQRVGHYLAADAQSATDIAAQVMEQLNAAELSHGNQGTVAKHALVHTLYFQFPLGIALLLLAIVWMLPDAVAKDSYE